MRSHLPRHRTPALLLLLMAGNLGLTACSTTPDARDLITMSCGKDAAMNDRILVTYATRAGSTAEVAEAIGTTLCETSSSAVDVLPVQQVKDLTPYRAVVIGSAVHMGSWLKEAKKFLKKNREKLTTMPVAYFGTCMLLADNDPEHHRKADEVLVKLKASYPEIHPVAEQMFAGKMDPERLSFPWKQLMRAKEDIPKGDFRDWDQIKAWAKEVGQQFQQGQ